MKKTIARVVLAAFLAVGISACDPMSPPGPSTSTPPDSGWDQQPGAWPCKIQDTCPGWGQPGPWICKINGTCH